MAMLVRREAAATRGESTLERQSRFHKAAKAKVYLKDPLVTAQDRGEFYDWVVVDNDTRISAGPTSSRFVVIDYDATRDRCEAPAAPADGDMLVFDAARGSFEEAQINAWATAIETLELFQQPIALGREVPWSFDGSRLRVLPHGMCDANAYYSPHTRALHFGYFEGSGGGRVKTSLSHDIVAHETGHAVLDGLRPLYMAAHVADTRAFHEYVGDLAAMLSLFQHREELKKSQFVRQDTEQFLDLVSDMAPEMGEGLDERRSFLRTARNPSTYDSVRDDIEPHKRSQVLSGMAFDLFSAIFERRPRRSGLSAFEHIMDAARDTVQLLIRPLDLLPPGSVRFPEYAAIVLWLDEHEHPGDPLGYRAALREILERRGLRPGKRDQPELIDGWALVDRDLAMIRSSRVGAYRFLDANRSILGIPEDRDFRVLSVATNRREGDKGWRPPAETILQYAWDLRADLSGATGIAALKEAVVHEGGTMVIDENVNVLYWKPQWWDDERLDEAIAHVGRLAKARAIDVEPPTGVRSGRPYVLSRGADRGVRLGVNASRMHVHGGI